MKDKGKSKLRDLEANIHACNPETVYANDQIHASGILQKCEECPIPIAREARGKGGPRAKPEMSRIIAACAGCGICSICPYAFMLLIGMFRHLLFDSKACFQI